MIKTSKVLGLLLGFAFLVACEKEENNLGDELIVGSILEHFSSDSTEIITTYKRIDSVNTLNPNFPIIGSSYDEEFGRTTASLYSELHLSQNEIEFGDNANLDSIVLFLKYTGYYGDTTLNQHFKIHELSENIDTIKKFSNQTYETGGLIGDIFFTPSVRSVTTVDGEESVAFLSQPLRLNDVFGESILSQSGTDVLSDNENFTAFFKGLYIEPQNNFGLNEGALFTVNYESSIVKLYYTNDTGSDSLNFVFNTSTKSLNHYEHDYTGSNALSSLQTDTNTENLYIQSLAGMDIKLELPDLSALDSAYINKAVLIIPRSQDTVANFKTYTRLRAAHYDEEEDEYKTIIDNPGGAFLADNNTYEFIVTRYIQEIVSGKTTENLYIRSSSNFSGAKTILNGVNHPDNKIKLHLTYSKEKTE
mgnify:CR=1 FL=1